MRIYTYNDIAPYANASRFTRPKSNLCAWYYPDRKQFCGNYCSRSGKHGDIFNRRCWRHKRRGNYSKSLPPVVILMIANASRIYNRDIWVNFLSESEKSGVPFELVIYNRHMLNGTVRHPQNILSRFRPFPDFFNRTVAPGHGDLAYTQAYLAMLQYGVSFPSASRCVVVTERTIPIRGPIESYRLIIGSKCVLDVSYNVKYAPAPAVPSPPSSRGTRGKSFEGVNNKAQGMFTVEFLKIALPTVVEQCEHFGLSFDGHTYKVSDPLKLETWREFTAANLDEFLLLNSFLLSLSSSSSSIRPISELKKYMQNVPKDDRLMVSEIPEWRDNLKRTFVFTDTSKTVQIPYFDNDMYSYLKGLHRGDSRRRRRTDVLYTSAGAVIRYLLSTKKYPIFFRSIELP